MKNLYFYALAAGLTYCAPGASAATEQITHTIYSTVTKPPEELVLPSNQTINVHGQTRSIIVDDKTGETSVEWCTGENHTDAAGKPTVGAGYCTVFYDDGDVGWISYTTTAADQISWTVMGGTGKYAGATGSGTTTVVSRRSDGASWTGKGKGTLTTK
jgi:hypothetical protein